MPRCRLTTDQNLLIGVYIYCPDKNKLAGPEATS